MVLPQDLDLRGRLSDGVAVEEQGELSSKGDTDRDNRREVEVVHLSAIVRDKRLNGLDLSII